MREVLEAVVFEASPAEGSEVEAMHSPVEGTNSVLGVAGTWGGKLAVDTARLTGVVAVTATGAMVVTATDCAPRLTGAMVVTATDCAPRLTGAMVVTATDCAPRLTGAMVVTATDCAPRLTGALVVTATDFFPRLTGAMVTAAVCVLAGRLPCWSSSCSIAEVISA